MNEFEALEAFEKAESKQDIILLLQSFNELLEIKISYFDFIHRIIKLITNQLNQLNNNNTPLSPSVIITEPSPSTITCTNNYPSSMNNKEDHNNSDDFNNNLKNNSLKNGVVFGGNNNFIYSNEQLNSIFKIMIEILDLTNHKSNCIDSIITCLSLIFNKFIIINENCKSLQNINFGTIPSIYLNKNNKNKNEFLTLEIIFNKCIECLFLALNINNFNTKIEYDNCIKHLQEIYFIYGRYFLINLNYEKSFEMFEKCLHLYGKENANFRKKIVRLIKFDFEESDKYLQRLHGCKCCSGI
ncbi:hypothetical protein ABK040_014780 [Willaertia magna]